MTALMNNIIKNMVTLLFILIGMGCNFQERENKLLEYYFTKPLPDTVPILFFPEYLDIEKNIRDITFSTDYKEFYFTQITNDTFIMTSKYKSGKWTKPSIASFSGFSADFEPFISPDNNSLYFASMRPSRNKPSMKLDIDIWKVQRTNSGWSKPILLDNTINTNCMEYYPSISKKGNLYFGRNDSALTRGDIYFSSLKNNNYTTPEKLPETINLQTTSFNAFISPDENYMIFSNYIQENEHWHSDLFISYLDENGNWKMPINLGNNVNSKGNELSPWISYDRKYLFFASTRMDTSGLNMKYNIFWVSTSAIENFD